uniref:Uncharacterized protein n=1 Tax=Oryza rufipogon TaxID=4529 RepID=A0A0E0RCJ3_ORYRU
MATTELDSPKHCNCRGMEFPPSRLSRKPGRRRKEERLGEAAGSLDDADVSNSPTNTPGWPTSG